MINGWILAEAVKKWQNIVKMKLEVFLKLKINNLNIYAYAVARLVEALSYKPKVRGFDFRWGHWDFSLT